MSPIAQLLMRLFGNGGPDRMESMPNPVHSGNGSVVRSGTGTPVTSRFGRGSAPIEERQMMDRAPVESRTLTDRPMAQAVPHENIRLEDLVVNMLNPNAQTRPWGRTPTRFATDVKPWNPVMDNAGIDISGAVLERLRR